MDWTVTQRKNQEEERNRKIIELYLRAWNTQESISELKRRTAKSVSDVLRGRWPGSVVNQEVMGRTRATISMD
jgi:hypothetical protein